MIWGPGKAADIVVRVIVVLAMVQAIPNNRKEILNIIIIMTTNKNQNPHNHCQSSFCLELIEIDPLSTLS